MSAVNQLIDRRTRMDRSMVPQWRSADSRHDADSSDRMSNQILGGPTTTTE